jgi:hypothetical protein
MRTPTGVSGRRGQPGPARPYQSTGRLAQQHDDRILGLVDGDLVLCRAIEHESLLADFATSRTFQAPGSGSTSERNQSCSACPNPLATGDEIPASQMMRTRTGPPARTGCLRASATR